MDNGIQISGQKMSSFSEIKYKIKKATPPFFYKGAVCYQYYKNLGIKCDLSKPQRYTEKIQWAKINRLNPLLTTLSDKIAVREWVEARIGKEYLIPTVGDVYSSADDIDFEVLPDRFVIKANHGSGYNIVVNDKNELNVKETKKRLNAWLSHNFAFDTFEMQYRNIIPKLYIEENIRKEDELDLPDYKFFCFDGRVFCEYVMINTVKDHTKSELGIFDRSFNLLPYQRADFKPITRQIPRPQEWWQMINIAETLSKGFSHVRVDLYNQNGRIYFGEMTFSTGSGLFRHEPEEFDFMLGKQWDLNSGI